MKKILASTSIIMLILLTTFTKNSTKKLDKEIFYLNEELRFLNEKYELVLLDFNFLSSPKKLFEYQKQYFENELIPMDVRNISAIEFKNEKFFIKELILDEK